MRQPKLWVPATVVILLFNLPPVFAYHSCATPCKGPLDLKTDTEIKGGDSNPLVFRSGQRLEHKAVGPKEPEYRCYEREVTNASTAPVTEVHWEIAHFYRAYVLAQKPVCEATGVEGPPKQLSGSITLGPSRTPRYPSTQVWAPDRGWPVQDSKTKQLTFSYTDVIPFWPQSKLLSLQLSNGMDVHFLWRDRPIAATLSLKSQVDPAAPNDYKYTYTISHDASVSLEVRWMLVSDGTDISDTRNDFKLTMRGSVIVPPGPALVFATMKNQPPKSGVGVVIVQDPSGRVIARGLASSYGPANGVLSDPGPAP